LVNIPQCWAGKFFSGQPILVACVTSLTVHRFGSFCVKPQESGSEDAQSYELKIDLQSAPGASVSLFLFGDEDDAYGRFWKDAIANKVTLKSCWCQNLASAFHLLLLMLCPEPPNSPLSTVVRRNVEVCACKIVPRRLRARAGGSAVILQKPFHACKHFLGVGVLWFGGLTRKGAGGSCGLAG
jgi:hypothetical protein